MEALFPAESEVSVDLTVQAASLLSETLSNQAKKLINLSKNKVQNVLEIQQQSMVPPEQSEIFFCVVHFQKQKLLFCLEMHSICFIKKQRSNRHSLVISAVYTVT